MLRFGTLLQNLGIFGDMVLNVLNGMMNAGGQYDDNLYLTAKVKVCSCTVERKWRQRFRMRFGLRNLGSAV